LGGGVGKVKLARVADTNSFENAHAVEAKEICNTKQAQVIHMSLEQGQSLKKHTTPVDVLFYVLEGKGIVEIGDEKQEVTKDTIVDSPKGVPHLLKNTEEGPFRFLVVKLKTSA
jgi:quercetin dioxygenase-like cupin family protein